MLVFLSAFIIGGGALVKTWKTVARLNTEVARLNTETAMVNELALAQTLANTILNNRDPIATAQKLCDMVADAVPPKASMPEIFSQREAHAALREIRKTGRNPYICGGASAMLMHLLEAAGLPARYVGVLNKLVNDAGYNSHVMVEFYDGAKWLLIDPSFNMMYTGSASAEEGGGYLSMPELYERLQGELPVIPVFLGQPDYKGIRIPDMLTYLKQFKFVYVAEAEIYWPQHEIFREQMRPPDWDGMMTWDGKPFSIKELGAFYGRTCAGHLR
ncbi:MAG: transglutaminase domain-containing protein [Deltaproteobacteria bacterium]|nr:transglutaminase domain-containing protein [Deltaproteobacteria bacterium]